MKKIFYFIAVILFISCWCSCRKETNPFIDAKAPAPAQVSGIHILNKPGGAVITYDIPRDPNLSYVKAVYEIQPGIFRQAKSSIYSDTLSLVGFGDTLNHEVKIYSVGRNDKESAPVSIHVNPSTPPVISSFKTLSISSTFGGVFVTFQDSTRADLAISVIMDSTGLGTWTTVSTYYTSQASGSFAARGLDTLNRKFGVFVRDHWNNRSDTLFKDLSPLYEQVIPKNLFKAYHLPGDSWESDNPKYNLEHLWNGLVNGHEDIFATSDLNKLPQWFTIDLGEKVILSRMKLFQRLPYPFNAVWVKEFAIWGSNDPDPDGSWGNWQLLGGPFPFRKLSGLPGFQYTADDLAYVAQGEDFIFPAGIPAVRYIRFKMIDSYGGVGKYQLGELTFWGQIAP